MAFTVLYDACVLHPAPLRDLLIRLGMAGVVRARWTEAILDECFRSVLRRRPDLSEKSLTRTRELMCRAVPDCLVEGYEKLIDGIELPDPDDRHVLATAVRAGAQVIVTTNLKDFPPSALEPYGVEAQHPDQYVLDLLDLAPDKVVAIVAKQSAAHLRSEKKRDSGILGGVPSGIRPIGELRARSRSAAAGCQGSHVIAGTWADHRRGMLSWKHMGKRPPWMTASPGHDDGRDRELRAMSPDERLEHFEQACELAAAMLRERDDAREVLQRRTPLSEASEALWRKLVRDGRGARAA